MTKQQGEWSVEEVRHEASSILTVVEPNGRRVASVSGYDGVGPSERARANARLIAAAPDLLEAARFLIDLHDADESNLDSVLNVIDYTMRAAVEKAEGR